MNLTPFFTITVVLLLFHSQNGVKCQAATDDELREFSETLYNMENSFLNRISVKIQGRTRASDTDDKAPLPLLEVGNDVLETPTISRMRALFDNYIMDTSIPEYPTAEHQNEQNAFLESIMATNIMRQAMAFLQSKGLVSSNQNDQRNLLRTLWFTLYNRGQGAIGSSGFEHVFLNEVKTGEIIGLHNWVYFSDEERAGRLNYKGYLKSLNLGSKALLLSVRFTHNGLNKPVNSLFIGTSPELDMALYTVCFKLRADNLCPVSMGGSRFTIQTYTWRYRGLQMIGSAYPKI